MSDSVSDVIAAVIERLQQREQTVTTLSFADVATAEETLFLTAATVVVTEVPPTAIADLYRLTTTPLTTFVQAAWRDHAAVTLQLTVADVNLVPWPLLTTWPVTIALPTGEVLTAQEAAVITRSDVLGLPLHAVLVKQHRQRLTMAAHDELLAQHIEVRERTDQACIWQE
ncbi:PduM family microcompartment protein [Furfurilactobacillus sp. WILCCON 0119]|uniref:PduM family microcompartment protein n=1 Tax=Furfurilactobacillus entadae TaxID=2922307 RepID=UPI0035EE9635